MADRSNEGAGTPRHGRVPDRRPEKDQVEPDREANAAFDRWLARELKDLYGEIANEPVPEHLSDLLKNRPNGGGTSDKR